MFSFIYSTDFLYVCVNEVYQKHLYKKNYYRLKNIDRTTLYLGLNVFVSTFKLTESKNSPPPMYLEALNREESMKFGMMVCFYMLFKVRRGSHSRNALVGVKWRKCGVKI